MSSSPVLETTSPRAEIVDLAQLGPACLTSVWELEAELWRTTLFWDVTPALEVLRRAVEKRALAGKAARVRSETVGYGYYLLEGHRAVLAGLTVDPRADRHSVGVPLVEELLSSMWRNATVRRVECQSIPFGLPWLGDYLQTKGFQKYERLFLRRSPQRVQVLEAPSREPLAPPARRGEIAVLPWNTTFLAEGARLMQQAHAGRIDAEMNEFYRSRDGCRALLENILFQRGCGIPILSASFAARRLPTQAFCGFVLVAQISRGHAHVAQVAVSPSTQGQGVGRLLLQHAIRALVGRNFQSVSLMVSQSNQKAFSLYRSLGFRRVLRFPVFSWDR